jgi:hypothetical protein
MQHRQTGFRRDGRSAHRLQQWIRENRGLIDELGLPADVIETRADFDYLLLHGYNGAGWQTERPWFKVFDASDARHRRFWDLLESYIAVFYADSVDSARDMLTRRFRPPGGAA